MIKPTVLKALSKLLLLALLLVLTLMAAKGSFGAVSKKSHDNSLGVVMEQDNPLTYLEGVPVSFASVGPGINIRFQPRGVYQLYSQDVLFCDMKDVDQKFGDADGVIVLTYDRQAHRTIEGVGCHDLFFVDRVATEKP